MAIKAKHTLSSILAQAWKVIFFPFFTKWNEITTTQILCKSSAHNFLQLPKIPADDLSVSENIAEVGFSIFSKSWEL